MLISVLKKYIWVVNLILIVGISYTLAQIVNDRIKGGLSNTKPGTTTSSESKGQKLKQLNSRSSYEIILKRNIFGLQSTTSGNSLIQDAPQTTLNLELLGTAIEPGERSIAIIKNLDTNKVRGYLEGELIDIIQSERVKLAKIENCRALVERSDGAETIRCKKDLDENASSDNKSRLGQVSALDRSSIVSSRSAVLPKSEAEGIKEVNEGEYEIDRKMLDELLSDPNQLLTQARVIPQEDGLRFFAIRPNSIFFMIGLRNGDILHKINDVELSNVENALSLFEELRGESQFNINLTRRGQKFTYEYSVK
ncbi:MAG TPA: type II secretion system protein GspC [Thermodesulfobacteriota bacterium]|nr:type II secretion system protein GspC [Thermodesulfobacteriota bacterium]